MMDWYPEKLSVTRTILKQNMEQKASSPWATTSYHSYLHLHKCRGLLLLLLHFLLLLASSPSSFASTDNLPCHQGGDCDKTQIAADKKPAADLEFSLKLAGYKNADEKEDDHQSSKENENTYCTPMEGPSESKALKQLKGAITSVIHQRLTELSEKAAHTIELLKLLDESNAVSDEIHEKVHQAAQLLRAVT